MRCAGAIEDNCSKSSFKTRKGCLGGKRSAAPSRENWGLRHPGTQTKRSFETTSTLLLLLLSLAAFVPSADGADVDYARDVLPIFEAHCYRCHGPEKQTSGYRLDIRQIALQGGDSGRPAIVPHAAEKSPLLHYVRGDDEDTVMPPKDSDIARLSAAEIATLSAWIEQGPHWPDELAGQLDTETLWSLKPLVQPALPSEGAHPIDAFIRAKLAEKNIAPSPAADRRTLIRRLSYDLTGLPPTVEELQAFVNDKDPEAYQKLVARLLASPRYGEHWARHWLDVANYADTHGNDHDYARPNAWHYRDYVIRALNEDKPYPRFVQEQVAGDRLFPSDPQATVALGFLAAGPWDHTLMVTVREDTIDHLSAQNLDRDNYVSTTMGTFQSLTVHCARCHNHKFDPISQREYYALQAVFAGVDRANRPFDTDAPTQAERARLRQEQQTLANPDAALLAELDSPAVQQKVADWELARAKLVTAWTPFEVESIVSTGGASFARQEDGSWFVSGERPVKDSYIVTARLPAGKLSAIRLEALPDDRLPVKGPGRWDNGNFHLSEFRAFAAAAKSGAGARPLEIASAAADYDEGAAISAAQAIDGKSETVWGVHPRYGEAHEILFFLKNPEEHPEGTTFTLLLEFQDGVQGHGIGRFRLSASGEPQAAAALKPLSASAAAIVQLPADQRTAEQKRELALAMLKSANQQAIAALPPPQLVYAVTNDFPPDGSNFHPSPQPRPIYLLTRGELLKRGELIEPGTLGCVPEMPATLAIANTNDEAARRAALALWLTDERNVLTWRSIVNRVWTYHFGRGLCDTPNDFGKMGGRPSHPELLDWLAVWFRDDAKGSLKALDQLILTSDTWRQSTFTDQGTEIDADNRLLWRQNRVRLAGEQVRDSILALSGQLDLTVGGPPAVQFISKGDATFNSGGAPAFLDYENFDQDSPAAKRRAIYRFIFRTVPDPLMDALDCPDGGTFTPVRNVSTTAVQAFAMLNNPFVIRQAEHIAALIAQHSTTPDTQTTAAFQRILLREASEAERAKFAAYIQQFGLANACQMLLNSNEFLYLD